MLYNFHTDNCVEFFAQINSFCANIYIVVCEIAEFPSINYVKAVNDLKSFFSEFADEQPLATANVKYF